MAMASLSSLKAHVVRTYVAPHRTRLCAFFVRLATRGRARGTDREAFASAREKILVVFERDVGLFSLVNQVCNTHVEAPEGTRMCVLFQEGCVYWNDAIMPRTASFWEAFFEPLGMPAAELPADVFQVVRLVRFFYGKLLPALLGISKFLCIMDCCVFFRVGGRDVAITCSFAPDVGCRSRDVAYRAYNDDPTPRVRRACAPFMSKELRPKPFIANLSATFWKRHTEGGKRKVVGVHIRGTDSLKDLRRPRWTMEQYFTAIDAAIADGRGGAKVYVATDDEAYIGQVVARYGSDRVFSYDAVRAGKAGSESSSEMYTETGAIMPEFLKTQNAASQNAVDVIVEYLNLCRCDFMVHGTSSVPAAVLLAHDGLAHANVTGPFVALTAAAARRKLAAHA